MSQVVRFEGPRSVSIAEYDDAPLEPNEVRLRTLFSGISAGTELTAYRGSNPYLSKRWDDHRRLFVEEAVTFRYPIDGWGYEEVGVVADVGTGVTEVKPGEVVWGTWGHRTTHTCDEHWAAARVFPPGVDPVVGVFSQIGAISLNAILDADIHVGEWVAVFGQGPPGLIATQLARLSGATVIAVDGIERRLEVAAGVGADHVVDFTKDDPASVVKELTDGRGADVSIEFSGSARALHDAIRATAYNSRVVASGFFQGDAVGLRLGEEFHHNRIDIVCSQISGVNPRVSHRWNERRLQQTTMALAAAGRIDLRALISHVVPFADAAEAFSLLDERQAEAVQVVLDFGAAS
jgi:2-desacetyl-2-hydroxyethyl bacteriochlorophyllide A dehydrogenase